MKFYTIYLLCSFLTIVLSHTGSPTCKIGTCEVFNKDIMDRRHGTHVLKNLTSIEITDSNFNETTKQIVKEVMPEWDIDNLSVKVFKDGITNKLVGFWDPKLVPKNKMILIRIYGQGTGRLINRTAEQRNMQVLSKHGYGPILYAKFKNGLCYEYIIGDILNVSSVKSKDVYPGIAHLMAVAHKIKLENETCKPFMWDKLQLFIDNIPDTYKDPKKQEQYQNATYKKQDLINEFKELRLKLDLLQSDIVFCHNDLLLANILSRVENGKTIVNFIDYEYSAYNFRAFDFANHFCEHAGVTTVNYTLLPDDNFMRNFIKEYYSCYNGNQNGPDTCTKGQVNSYDVEKLFIQSKKFMLASHLFWGCWAYAQADISLIDFDYLGYGFIRMEEYKKMKHQYLSIPYPPTRITG